MPTRAKISREIIAKLAANVATGAPWDACARAAGIGTATFRRWRADSVDAPEGSLLAELREALERAEGEAELALVAIVRDAAPSDWRAAIALLERRWPDRWSQRRQLEAKVEAVGEAEPYSEYWKRLQREHAAQIAQLEHGAREGAPS